MATELDPKEFLEMGKTFPMVDVRTSAEFENGHIPGAHNLPIFTNEERVVVGTKYKKVGKVFIIVTESTNEEKWFDKSQKFVDYKGNVIGELNLNILKTIPSISLW